MKKTTKTFLLFVLLLSLFTPSLSVHADVAPPSQPYGSNVSPGETTMVQMIYERVVIDLRPPWSNGIDADVTAKFIMRNQGTVDEKMSVGFPLNRKEQMTFEGTVPRLKDLIVKVNGVNVSTQIIQDDNWLKSDDWRLSVADWAVFDVVFPVGQDVIIDVNYKQPPTFDAPTTQYDYTLITGAGWHGTILEGDIIFRLPYTISYWENYWTYDDENVWGGLITETVVENEVRWRFENLEPQGFRDNWIAHVVRPKDWERVLSARNALIDNQYNAELWLGLGDAYSNAAIELGGKTADSSYPAITAYEQSVTLKPDWAEAHARLALEYYKAYRDSEFYASEEHPPDKSLKQGALQELSVALALEPNNKTALSLQEEFNWLSWELPPPTPHATPTINSTSLPTETPIVVTVVQTKLVSAPTFTPKPEISTSTSLPIELTQDKPQKETSATPIVFGAIILFVAGIGVGTFWQKRRMSP